MKYEIIGSSSKGNCIVVEDIIALDMGVSYFKVRKYLKKVKLIFISHVHTDHLNKTTIKQIAYNYPTIKFICGSRDVLFKLLECNVNRKNIYFVDANKWHSLGILHFRLEPLFHDVENYCIKVRFLATDKKLVYIVDTNSVENIEAKNYDLFLIESNYNTELLEKHIQETEAVDRLYYLNRAKNTHLSSEQCTDFLLANMGENSEFVRIHKSSFNYEERE